MRVADAERNSRAMMRYRDQEPGGQAAAAAVRRKSSSRRGLHMPGLPRTGAQAAGAGRSRIICSALLYHSDTRSARRSLRLHSRE
jgi:hypothetical protein